MCKTLLASAFIVAAIAGCKPKAETAADNTARNDRGGVTADKAVDNRSDLDLTQAIRKSLMSDGSLSTNAHNCKVVVNNGTVTLMGPVASNDERTKVEQLAAAAAGGHDHVIDQLEVTN